MSLLIIAFISLLGIIVGKILFKKWFNHLMLYCVIFGGMIFLYELKLLPYVELTSYTWFIIVASFLSFALGIITILSARNQVQTNFQRSDIYLKIFSDDGKTLKYTILLLSIISLYSAIEFWLILIKQFGSIPGVLINGQAIYRMNVAGEIKGNTPYIFLLGFVAVFFAGIYTAYKRKITLLTFLPLISVILREIALAGRIGMLISLLEFTISFLLFRHLLVTDVHQRFRLSKANIIIASIIMITLFVAGASLVRVSRVTQTSEKFSGASRELSQMKENFILSPSVYLYASSSVGVLSKYLDSGGEKTKFGQNTFQSFYMFLAKLGIVEKPSEYPKGYFIPMWTNAATYLRDIHADFGISGVLLIPYLTGLLITFFWFKFYEQQSLIIFALLVYFYLIIGISPLVMVTRFYYWTVDLLLILIFIPIIEKIAFLVSSSQKKYLVVK